MLEVSQVTKRYGNKTVLDGASINVKDREVRVIIGLNGSGKSTLLKIITGIVPADSGKVVVGGLDITGLAPEDRRIGYVPQSSALFRHLTVEENIRYCLRNRRGTKESFSGIVSMLGLEGYLASKPAALSGGYKCRVSLARALISQPRIMLLDEPLTEVDRAKKEELLPAFKKIIKGLGVPVLYITHDPWEAGLIGDTFSIIDKGKVRDIASLEEAFNIVKAQAVEAFIGQSA